MALVRWNPWQEMNSLQRQMNSLFDDMLVPSASVERNFPRIPAAELQETAEAIHLKLELPGIEAKDLDVQVTQNAISIKGERKSETKTEEKGVIPFLYEAALNYSQGSIWCKCDGSQIAS